MSLAFEPMTCPRASEIVRWKYESPYDIYGCSDSEKLKEIARLADRENQFFAVLNDDNELIGFRSFGEDGRVQGGHYDEPYLDTGGGLRPDLTGKGLGLGVIAQGLLFGHTTYGARRFRGTIARFNERAQIVCRRLGFVESQRFLRPTDKREFVIMLLEDVSKLPVSVPEVFQL